jgi:hypothetical protein
MPLNYFRPRPHRIGTELIQVGIGNPGALSPVAVASSTVIYKFAPANGRYFLEKLSLFIGTLAAGSAAITAQAFRRNSVGSVSQALSAATDLKTGSVNVVRSVAISATEQNRYFQDGDYFAVDIVAAGTITQQPVDLYVKAELAVLE